MDPQCYSHLNLFVYSLPMLWGQTDSCSSTPESDILRHIRQVQDRETDPVPERNSPKTSQVSFVPSSPDLSRAGGSISFLYRTPANTLRTRSFVTVSSDRCYLFTSSSFVSFCSRYPVPLSPSLRSHDDTMMQYIT